MSANKLVILRPAFFAGRMDLCNRRQVAQVLRFSQEDKQDGNPKEQLDTPVVVQFGLYMTLSS